MKKLSRTTTKIAVAAALGLTVAVGTAASASANSQWGPYSDRGSCQADRTMAMQQYNTSATSCAYIATWGWYFILNN
jgi:Spy/CpxP family protein refolding chaperone